LISEFSDNSTTTYTSGTTPQQAPADSISLLLYQFGDHLTTRMTADNFASNASYEGHYPFGETWYDTGMAYPSVTKKFTSYNKDTEASTAFLNYAIFRQHSARLGRFHMADPVQGSTSNPQSLNRFSYGLSDPINNVDPTGLFGVKVYIPPDWPCRATEVVCGCDPFESMCTEGYGYPPSGGGGGFGPGGGTPPSCEGPGTTSKSQTGPPLCNQGDTFVEQWDCPSGCTLEQCGPKATQYSLQCDRRGKQYYALCANFFGFTGATKYCHCCIQNKKSTVLSNRISAGIFGSRP
jgi:RHS repeat-associated protein